MSGGSSTDGLGRFDRIIREYMQSFNEIAWMAHAGEMPDPPGRLVRATSFEAARAEYHVFVKVSTAVWRSLDAIAEATERRHYFDAMEDYFIDTFQPDPIYYEWTIWKLGDAISSDLKGCLREVILDDVAHVTFYRESLAWYRRGHWRCGIDTSGRPIIW